MRKFSLKQNDSVYIYGAGAFGKRIYLQIKDRFYVHAFLDRRIFEAEDGYPRVFSIEEGYSVCPYACVIVCVHNGNWHCEIAEKLEKQGFCHILFLPVDSLYEINKDAVIQMKLSYCHLLEGNYDQLNDIPIYAELKGSAHNLHIIRESKKYVVTMCPHEIVYSYEGIEPHKRERVRELCKKGIISEYLLNQGGVPIASYEVYLTIFRFFMTGNKEDGFDDFLLYLQNMNNSFEISQEECLNEQWKIFELLEKEYMSGLDKMKFAPIDVRWNVKGYFNIMDGHHRAAFYYLKGIDNFVVRMYREDFEKWKNAESYDKVNLALKKFVPSCKIFNPLFLNIKMKSYELGNSLCDFLCNYIVKNNLLFDMILECGNWNGNFSREIYRMGKAKKILSLAKDAYDLEFQNSLNDLYYMPIDNVQVALELRKECLLNTKRVGIISDRMISLDDIKQIEKLNIKFIDFFLILESDKMIEDSLLNKFCKDTVIATKCVNGKSMCLKRYEVKNGDDSKK